MRAQHFNANHKSKYGDTLHICYIFYDTPPPPDVAPPPKPMPAFTLNPTATSSLTVHSVYSPLKTSSSLPSMSPPAARPILRPRGRSKHKRWSDDCLGSSGSDGSPSYRDVVLSSPAPVSLAASAEASATGLAFGMGGDVVATEAVVRPTP